MDKSIEEGCSIIKIIELTLGEEIREEHKITEVRISEVDIEVTLGMITLDEVEVGLEKDSTQVTSDEMREAVVDLDQVQEQVLIETGLDALKGREYDHVASSSRSRSGSRASTNRNRIRCFKCREYDHVAKDLQIYQIMKKRSQSRYRKCLT